MKTATLTIVLFLQLILSSCLEQNNNSEYQAEQERQRLEVERQAELERRKEEMYEIADQVSKFVVDDIYDCGKAIDWDIYSWEYNEYKGEYKIEMRIEWSGCILGGYYEISGIARSDNYETTWKTTYQNDNVEDYVSMKNITIGAIGTLVVLDEISKNY